MTELSRRAFIGSSAATAAAPLLAPSAASAQEAERSLQGASFYRFALGDHTLTMRGDGNPAAEVFASNADPEAFRETQERLFQPTDGVDFHLNAMLIETGDRRILVDAGKADPQASHVADAFQTRHRRRPQGTACRGRGRFRVASASKFRRPPGNRQTISKRPRR